MNKIRLNTLEGEQTLNDLKVLKELIINNPTLPVVAFVGQEAWKDEKCYNEAEDVCVEIDELTFYNNMWSTKEDYIDDLYHVLLNSGEYKDSSSEEFEKAMNKKVEETEFIKAITIWIL